MKTTTQPVLLVTGASRGIGAATALLAARSGYAVAVNYCTDEQAADAVVRQIHALGGNAIAIQADVSREDDVLRMFATNVFGSMLCAREAIRRMSISKGGSGGAIVNVSSAASRLGSPGEYVDYAASKGAIDTFTIGLAKEVAGEGIRVNAVRPGFILTDMHASGGEPGRIDRVKAGIPLQRGGRPEEVAAAILWLLSPASSYSTGALIDASGGR